MSGLNNVTLIGRLGKDPETTYTKSGKAITRFSLAVNEGYGEKEHVTWIDITCWEKTAESVQQYLGKGSEVCIVGRINTESWEGKDGKKNYKTGVVAERVIFLGGKNEETANKGRVDSRKGSQTANSGSDITDDGSDLPF